MTLKTRDAWIVALAPAMLGAMVYVWLYARPGAATGQALADRAALIERSAPSPMVLVDKRAANQRLSDQLAEERAREARMQQQLDDFRRLWTEPADRPAALQDVSRLIGDSGMVVLTASSSEAGAGGVVGPALQRVVADLRRTEESAGPELWRIEAVGSYAAMVQVLRQLPEGRGLVVPVNVSLVADEQPDAHRWTLWVWL